MSYKDGEELILELVQGSPDFASGNAVRGKWGVLNSGNSDHYAIIYRGPYLRNWAGMKIIETEWRTIIQVWQRYKDEFTSYEALTGYVDDLMTYLDPYRKLTSTTILDANVVGGGEIVTEWRNNSDGPSWLKQEIYIDWKEQSNVTFAE